MALEKLSPAQLADLQKTGDVVVTFNQPCAVKACGKDPVNATFALMGGSMFARNHKGIPHGKYSRAVCSAKIGFDGKTLQLEEILYAE